jgi:predicted nucleotidyltransferase
MPISPEVLEQARSALLDNAVAHFREAPGVAGIFLAGSLAAGSADPYSDIDLRVVVEPERHRQFVEQRRSIPAQWPGFLFNEWIPNAQHCVSHFEPFGKIDIFYLSASALAPSPWYRLPIRILHDPQGIVADLVARSQGLPFVAGNDDVDVSISKGLAAAHEAYRRAVRGELFFAETLLDELRHHMMQADDWLHDRTAEAALVAKFDARGSPDLLAALRASYCPCDGEAILAAVSPLARFYQIQVMALHEKFRLSRPLANDIAALKIVQ